MSFTLEKRVGRFLSHPARWLACFGGLVLTFIALLTVVSIIGRALNGMQLGGITFSAVKGDFELVEIGAAVAVFCFLPWCQLNRGHVRVDIINRVIPSRLNALLELIGDLAIAIIAVVITWRIWMGMGERVTWFSQELRDVLGFGYKPFSVETTFILGWPTWYGYAVGFLGCFLFSLVALYTVWRSINEVIVGEVAQ